MPNISLLNSKLNSPTRITESSNTLVDYVLRNTIHALGIYIKEDDNISYHETIYIKSDKKENLLESRYI